MKKRNNRFFKLIPPGFVFFVVIIIGLILTNCENNGKDKAGNNSASREKQAEEIDPKFKKVILKVNKRSYTNLDFKSFFKSKYSEINSNNFSKVILKSFFDQFVDRILLINRIIRDNFTISDEDFKKYLESFIVSENTNIEELKVDYLIQKYLAEVIYKDINITENQIMNYYQKNRKNYKKKEQVLVYQIKTNTKKEALEIRQMLLRDPKIFEEIAREKSISLDAKDGGQMGYFEKGILPKVIESYVFNLRKNDLSQIVESPYGFHIFKVTDKKRSQTLPLYQVKDEIRKQLVLDQTIVIKMNLLSNLRKENYVASYFENLYLLKNNYHEQEGEKYP